MSITRHQDQPRRTNRQRALAFALVGLGVVGIGAASASQLTVTGGHGDVASGVVTVVQGRTGSVEANVVLGDTVAATDGSLPVTHVQVSGLATATDASVRVIALNSAGDSIGEGTADVTAATQAVPLGGNLTNHTPIAKIAVVLTPTTPAP